MTTIMLIAGLVLLVAGGELLVRGASKLAISTGISPLVVGLTVVAFGTSSPELAVSVAAVRSGETDIALGNVVGSNIFNILGVLGVLALAAETPLGVPASLLAFDLPVMVAVALACLPIFFTGNTIARWEGGLFLGYYAAYTAYLLLLSQRHEALATYTLAMPTVVLPLTAVTVLVVTARAWKARHASPP